jgi:hypothetical protein
MFRKKRATSVDEKKHTPEPWQRSDKDFPPAHEYYRDRRARKAALVATWSPRRQRLYRITTLNGFLDT